jgi:hypothetical protein
VIPNKPDKFMIKFIADLMYAKGCINSNELDAMYDICTIEDMDSTTNDFLNGVYNTYKKGESYYKREIID